MRFFTNLLPFPDLLVVPMSVFAVSKKASTNYAQWIHATLLNAFLKVQSKNNALSRLSKLEYIAVHMRTLKLEWFRVVIVKAMLFHILNLH